MSMAPSSPRLPSPPPTAEIQIGPKSPSMNNGVGQQAQQQKEQTALDANARRRVHPGTKSREIAAGPPVVPLNELDSAFQLQEHLAALHYSHTGSKTRPMTRDTASLLAAPPPNTDRTLWLYELCRLLIGQCNSLIVGFLFDSPPCSAATCPEMRASEWQFLCAVHESPKSCCAIDYCCHTLDWAANVVTNPKIFPSRFVAPDAAAAGGGGSAGGGGAGHGDRGAALKNLVNVFRRLHRIFAHAWFQHRGVFWSVETHTGLYVFFKTVCDLYDLLPAENYKLPPDAEGMNPTAAVHNSNSNNNVPEVSSAAAAADRSKQGQHHQSVVPTGILLRPEQYQQPPPPSNATTAATTTMTTGATEEEESFQPVGRTATRRHVRSNPSTGSAVTTVMEADEDESAAMAKKLREMHISAPPVETVEEEAGLEEDSGAGEDVEVEVEDQQEQEREGDVEVPVMVMHGGAGVIANVTPQAMKPEEALPLPGETEAVHGQAETPAQAQAQAQAEEDREAKERMRSPMEPMTAFPDDKDDDAAVDSAGKTDKSAAAASAEEEENGLGQKDSGKPSAASAAEPAAEIATPTATPASGTETQPAEEL